MVDWIDRQIHEKRIALNRVSTDDGLRTRLSGLKPFHLNFLRECCGVNLKAGDYPFNTERMGIRSLANYMLIMSSCSGWQNHSMPRQPPTTKSAVFEDGLSYTMKTSGTPFKDNPFISPMSCFLCGRFRERFLMVSRNLCGKSQNVCSPSCNELELALAMEDVVPSPDRIKASQDAMVAWVDGVGGQQDLVCASSRHEGPVKEKDDLHCIQKTGPAKYAVHKLSDLDAVPTLNDGTISIQYRDGKGRVGCGKGKGMSLG